MHIQHPLVHRYPQFTETCVHLCVTMASQATATEADDVAPSEAPVSPSKLPKGGNTERPHGAPSRHASLNHSPFAPPQCRVADPDALAKRRDLIAKRKSGSPLYYGDYLQLDKILDAQHPISKTVDMDAHDEHLFIIIHQVHNSPAPCAYVCVRTGPGVLTTCWE